MAKGGFVVNWDGKQERCAELYVDFDGHSLSFYKKGAKPTDENFEVKDWSTFSAHAITKKEAEDIVYDKPLGVEEVEK